LRTKLPYMPSLFEQQTTGQIIARIESLTPENKAQWGKMNVSQMLTHCNRAMLTATGESILPRMFMGRILGPFIRHFFYNDKPFAKNSPTDATFVVTGEQDFVAEKAKLIAVVNRFAAGGEAKCTTQPHSFFGRLTPAQWAIGMYKHLDHHLRQFNA